MNWARICSPRRAPTRKSGFAMKWARQREIERERESAGSTGADCRLSWGEFIELLLTLAIGRPAANSDFALKANWPRRAWNGGLNGRSHQLRASITNVTNVTNVTARLGSCAKFAISRPPS